MQGAEAERQGRPVHDMTASMAMAGLAAMGLAVLGVIALPLPLTMAQRRTAERD